MIKLLNKWTFVVGLAALGFLTMVSSNGFAERTHRNQAEATRSFLGSYLAGRYASAKYDTTEAAAYFRRALARAPENKRILEQTFLLELMDANWEITKELSTKLVVIDPGHPFARLFNGVTDFKNRDFASAEDNFIAGSDGALGELIAKIARAWILSGKGEYTEAIKLLSEKSETDWVRDYQQYHRALIADVNSKPIDAKKAYTRLFRKYHQMVRLVGSYAQFLVKNGERTNALNVLKKHFEKARYKHPDLIELERRIKENETITPYVQTPNEGLAEIFFSLGDRRAENGGVDDGLIFLQLARYLRPGFTAANYSLGSLLFRAKKYERSVVMFSQIKSDAPIWLEAQIQKAQNFSSKGDTKRGIRVLEALTDSYGQDIELFNGLAKLYLDDENYQQAAENYSRAINLIANPKTSDWFYFYGRGIAFERLKQWPKAEADFRRSLKLSPNRADVLNYLGYSWVDQNLNLSQALGLIRRAVKLKPTSGYYVDSLGWANYRLGRYKEAVGYLEQAVELRPDDPVINDHLGDVYWRVGRHDEARFQWKQVLSLEPEKELEKKIQEKLKFGLSVKRQALAPVEKQPSVE